MFAQTTKISRNRSTKCHLFHLFCSPRHQFCLCFVKPILLISSMTLSNLIICLAISIAINFFKKLSDPSFFFLTYRPLYLYLLHLLLPSSETVNNIHPSFKMLPSRYLQSLVMSLFSLPLLHLQLSQTLLFISGDLFLFFIYFSRFLVSFQRKPNNTGCSRCRGIQEGRHADIIPSHCVCPLQSKASELIIVPRIKISIIPVNQSCQ